MLVRSATFFSSLIASIIFLTGVDSPVRLLSCVSKLYTSKSLASAGILSPSLNNITSPGTISLESRRTSFPSRITFAFRLDSFFSASIDFSALYSCMKPNPAFMRRIIKITMLSSTSPIIREIIVAATNIRTMKLLNWSKNI